MGIAMVVVLEADMESVAPAEPEDVGEAAPLEIEGLAVFPELCTEARPLLSALDRA